MLSILNYTYYKEVITLKCQNCGDENKEGSKYCNQCGLPLLNVQTQQNKINLGGYEDLNHPHIKKSNHSEVLSNQNFNERMMIEDSEGYDKDSDEILDRDHKKKKRKRKGSPILKMTLVMVLALFIFFGYNGIQYAMNAQEQRVTQAEITKQQQSEAEELQRLENYREKFNAVVSSYEEQGILIGENIDKLTTLRINRFAKNLGLGNLFNRAVNTVFDVSKVNELKSASGTLNVLVEELMNPPETFATKYQSLQNLQSLENAITQTIQGEISSNVKKELTELHEEYIVQLENIKR